MANTTAGKAPAVFRYKGRRTPLDRCLLMLWVITMMGIPLLLITGLPFWALLFLIPLGAGLREYFAKEQLEIHEDDLRHGNPHFVLETVEFGSVAELLESEYDLCVVHQRKSEWVRLTFSKDGFSPHCWSQMVKLMAQRTAAHSPGALIEVK